MQTETQWEVQSLHIRVHTAGTLLCEQCVSSIKLKWDGMEIQRHSYRKII